MSSSRIPPSVPIGLLVLASALSSSTACLSTAAVVTIGAVGTAGIAGVAAASQQLEKNRASHLGYVPAPVVTDDPASIARALQPALPAASAGGRQGERRVAVTLLPDEAGTRIYEIRAFGDFTPAYAQAFANFSNRLRTQLPGKNRFILLTIHDARGADHLVSRLEVD